MASGILTVPVTNIRGEAGIAVELEYAESLDRNTVWRSMATITLTGASEFIPDPGEPLNSERWYRTSQPPTPNAPPTLTLYQVPAITLRGAAGSSLRLDYIPKFGPTDAWEELATVTLTNTVQTFFDLSSIDQPLRLYRIVQVP